MVVILAFIVICPFEASLFIIHIISPYSLHAISALFLFLELKLSSFISVSFSFAFLPHYSAGCWRLLPHIHNRLTQKGGTNQNEKSTFLFELFSSSDMCAIFIILLPSSIFKLTHHSTNITQWEEKKDHKLNRLCVRIDLWLCMMRKITFNRILTYSVRRIRIHIFMYLI